MKKNRILGTLAIVLALSFVLGLASCNSDGGTDGQTTSVPVTTETNDNEVTTSEAEPESPVQTEYVLISEGSKCNATAQTGSMTVANGYVKMNSAVLTLNENVVLPFGEKDSWSIAFDGILAPNGSGKGNILADKTEKEGRVYLGVNASNQIIFMGICINGVYANYCWSVPVSTLSTNHKYRVEYTGEEFLLYIDSDEATSMSIMNVAQKNPAAITGKQAATELIDKIRAVKGQAFVTMKFIGSSTHPCTSELSSLEVKTSSFDEIKMLTTHPLSDLTIYYLGSSITRGHGGNTDGTSFADITATLTGSKYEKKAVSGTTLAVTSSRTDSYIERFSQLPQDKAPDYIVIQLSSNDFKKSIPLGNVSASKDLADFSQNTITGAIETLIARSKQQWGEGVTVVFYSCPIGNTWTKYTQYRDYVNGTMKELEEKWKGDMVMLDIFNSEYVVSPAYIQSDALHPQKEGYSQLIVPEWIKLLYELEGIE